MTTHHTKLPRDLLRENSSTSRQTVACLREQLRRMQTAGRAEDPGRISSGVAEMDRMLPDGGYLPGNLVEFVSNGEGDAARWMSLNLAARSLQRGGSIVLVDTTGELYAPGLVAMGIAPEQMVIVHAGQHNDAYWAIDQSLRCEAVAAVWGYVPTTDSRWLRRFQISAEASGALGIFLRPESVLPCPSWSDVQWSCRPSIVSRQMTNEGEGFSRWYLGLRLERARAGTGQQIDLVIDASSGRVQAAGKRPSSRTPLKAPPEPTISAARFASHRDSPPPGDSRGDNRSGSGAVA